MKLLAISSRLLFLLLGLAAYFPVSARAQNAGNVDLTFDPGVGPSNPIYALAVQPDGKIVIGGNFLYLGGYTVDGFARLNADGSIDFTFNPGDGADQRVLVVALQPDGKVLIGGAFTTVNGYSRNGLARLNTDGSVDTTFGDYAGANDVVRGIAVQPDGQILVTGDFTTYNNYDYNHIVRLNGTDGSLDFNFTPGQGASAATEPVVVQPDGTILVGGDFLYFNGVYAPGLVRLDSSGNIDTSFGYSGSPYPDNYIDTLLLQPDGSILIGGGFTNVGGAVHYAVARLNADGTVDGSFADPSGGPDGAVYALGLEPDGDVIIGGDFTSVDGIDGGSIARLFSDGTLDTSYGPGYPANGAVSTLALLANGETVAGGAFTSIGGITRDFIAQLYQDPTTNPANASFVRLLSLSNMQFTANSTVELTADISSPTDPVTSIAFYNNDTMIAQSSSSIVPPAAGMASPAKVRKDVPFQQSFANLGALLTAGLNDLKAVATTQSGATLTSNVSAVMGQANAAQTATCQISSPQSGPAPAAGTQVQINVQKSTQAVTVQFYVDSAKGAVDQVQPGDQSVSTFSLPVLSADRPHYLSAVVTDNTTGISQQSDTVTLTPPVQATPPVVTISVPGTTGEVATIADNGPAIKLRITRSAASGNAADLDVSQPLVVSYKAKGSAQAGVDYEALSGSVTIPAGAATVKLKIKPIAQVPSGSIAVLKLGLLPSIDDSYTPAAGFTKVKIVGE